MAWNRLEVSAYVPTAVDSPDYDLIFQLQLDTAPYRPGMGLIDLRRVDAPREKPESCVHPVQQLAEKWQPCCSLTTHTTIR